MEKGIHVHSVNLKKQKKYMSPYYFLFYIQYARNTCATGCENKTAENAFKYTLLSNVITYIAR